MVVPYGPAEAQLWRKLKRSRSCCGENSLYSDSGINETSDSLSSSTSERATWVRTPLPSRSVIVSGVCSTIRPDSTRPSLGGNLVRLIFLPNHAGGIDQADQEKVAIMPVRVGQVRADGLSLTEEAMTGRAAVLEEPAARALDRRDRP